MANTTYVDFQGPLINAAWLNDVNNVVYNILGNTTLAPTSAAIVRNNLGIVASTANADLENGVYVAGDILYASATDTLSKLAVGSESDVLTIVSGVPAWAPASSIDLETNGTPNGDQTKLNLVAGTNVTLTDNGTGSVTIDSSGGGSSILLQTNGVNNGSQSTLNLKAGTNITLSDDGVGGVTITSSGGGGGGGPTLATARVATGQSAISFTGLPTGLKRITISLEALSNTSASGYFRMRVGASGGLQTSSYFSSAMQIATTGNTVDISNDGIRLTTNLSNNYDINGIIVGTLLDPATNQWVFTSSLTYGLSGSFLWICNTTVEISAGELRQLQLTPPNGTTFSFGNVGLMYE
jgi:hypothetical protein